MGYRPQVRSRRSAGRGSQKSPRDKAKAKRQRYHSRGRYLLEGTPVPAREGVVEKNLGKLRILGNQKFAVSPFSQYFDDWLVNLREVLSEFESSPNINANDQFVKERSQIVSNVEFKLEERRRKEASLEESIKNLSNSKNLLERIKEEYATRVKEIERRKNSEIKHLYSNIDSLRGELDDIVRMKTGLFRGISKKAREQKETETTQRVNTGQRELELAILDFTVAQEKLRDEYERKRQPIIKQIRDRQKKIENLETDGSLEDKWFACEALVDAVNALLQRKTLQLH